MASYIMTNDQSLISNIESSRVALYVHVPFCRTRCAYCDFNTYAGLGKLIPAYVAAVCREIEAAGERWGRLAVPTIYFGGGTPSLLPLNLLAELFRALRLAFHILDEAEITLEANPGTVTPAYLCGLRELGVNRLSLGVQSAHGEELQLLGRSHTWGQAVEAVAWAREAGLANLSLDLIFGLPAQRLSRWRETLEAALRLSPEHLSLYCLNVEQGTPLENRISSGELPAPDDDLAAEMYELAEDVLAGVGFFHYEISNWARMNSELRIANPELQRWWPQPGTGNLKSGTLCEHVSPYVCRHNLVYWRNEPWLGVGAGAHSWLGGAGLSLSQGQRWANVLHPREYIAVCGTGCQPVLREEVEVIDHPLEMGETMMLGLRLAEGVRASLFEARFGEALDEVFGEELGELRELGLLEWDGSVARLTARGRLLGNRVFARFV
ncbi:MAG: radical SAM family heme chaperone HemW [Chloroflexota bacterium]|nr:radical SAM family heme chaperone HemW [Chloroflexota bacterium]